MYTAALGGTFELARRTLKNACPNMYTFQTQLSKLKRWLEARALPEEVTKQFKLTDEEYKAYQDHKCQVDLKKAERLGLVRLDEADHDAWDLAHISNEQIKFFLGELARVPSVPNEAYVRALILGGRRGQDMFQARFYQDTGDEPTWSRIANACKARQKEQRSYKFPLLCPFENFHRLVQMAREDTAEYRSAQAYHDVAQRAIDDFIYDWPFLREAAAGRPVTPHRLRKLYAALLLRCYDTHPLGADEFLKRAFNHQNAATRVYFPSSGATVDLGEVFAEELRDGYQSDLDPDAMDDDEEDHKQKGSGAGSGEVGL